MTNFEYTIKGITLNEDEVKEIYTQYKKFCYARNINERLELNDMTLAQEIAYFFVEQGWSFEEDLTDAVYNYQEDIVTKYILEHNIASESETDPISLLEQKTGMDIRTGKNLCEELMPLHHIQQQLNKWWGKE